MRAERLKATVQSTLWNPALEHFTDRYQVTNANVRYGEFIRGRELAGYVPWAYGLPDDDPKYNAAWRHLLAPEEFAGPYGLRTVGPSYEHYLRQYRYEGKAPECQWNGPSWPFQTTQGLTGMANLLNASRQTVVGAGDYLRLLRQYTDQHLLDGTPDLQEDYNPDTGRPIVGLERSHHYNHSGYTDLVVTGLCGLRPRADDTLDVNPLVPKDGKVVGSFLLENVPYHGHAVTILWDADGGGTDEEPGSPCTWTGDAGSGRARSGARCARSGSLGQGARLSWSIRRSTSRGRGSRCPRLDGTGSVGVAGDRRAHVVLPRGSARLDREGRSGRTGLVRARLRRPTKVAEVRLAFLQGEAFAAPSAVGVEAWTDGRGGRSDPFGRTRRNRSATGRTC